MTTIAHKLDLQHGWINVLRALGIVLVVLGHTLGIGEWLEKYIYSFHMPLFFFISGLVLTESRLAIGWREAGRHYALRLLVPYLLFSLITYVPWVFLTRKYGAEAVLNVPAWKPLIGTFYGIGIDGWLQHNAMLWFFPCLFVVHMVFRVIKRKCEGASLIFAIIACAVLGYALALSLPIRLPWGGEAALLAIPFYAAGYALSQYKSKLSENAIPLVFVAMVLGSIQLGCIITNGRVDMNFLSLGNPLVFYLGAFAGIGALAGVAALLPMCSCYNRIADASIVAFSLHRVMFSVFTTIGLLLVADMPTFKSSAWGSVIYTGGAILVSLILWPWIRRYFPLLVGGR